MPGDHENERCLLRRLVFPGVMISRATLLGQLCQNLRLGPEPSALMMNDGPCMATVPVFFFDNGFPFAGLLQNKRIVAILIMILTPEYSRHQTAEIRMMP
jgi:hypothetical protein